MKKLLLNSPKTSSFTPFTTRPVTTADTAPSASKTPNLKSRRMTHFLSTPGFTSGPKDFGKIYTEKFQ